MTTLREILQQKDKAVITITQQATVYEAVQSLMHHRIGSLVVIGPDEKVVGIITERDILREVDRGPEQLRTRKVADAMSSNLIVGVPDDDIEYTMGVMTNNRIRHLPVMDGDKLEGIISIGDVVKAQLHHAVYENRYLKDYIQAR